MHILVVLMILYCVKFNFESIYTIFIMFGSMVLEIKNLFRFFSKFFQFLFQIRDLCVKVVLKKLVVSFFGNVRKNFIFMI